MKNATIIKLHHADHQHADVVVHFFEQAELVTTLKLTKVDYRSVNELEQFLGSWAMGKVARMEQPLEPLT